jgi:hypothetical protein
VTDVRRLELEERQVRLDDVAAVEVGGDVEVPTADLVVEWRELSVSTFTLSPIWRRWSTSQTPSDSYGSRIARLRNVNGGSAGTTKTSSPP